MKFVEDDQPDTGQFRIFLQTPDEYAFSHHLDSRGRRETTVETYPITHGLSQTVTGE